jgi:hypothetical protein
MRWYQCVAYFFGGPPREHAPPTSVTGSWGTPSRVRFASPPGQRFGGRDEGAATRQSGRLFS